MAKQLLLLSPCAENQGGGEGRSFSRIEFWVQITRLLEEWYSSKIGKNYSRTWRIVPWWRSGLFGAQNSNFFHIWLSVQVEKPLHRFLWACHLVEDVYRSLFKYKHVYNLCFWCGCLGHLRRECCHPQTESIIEKLWYGSWIQAELVARTLIVWTMTREGFLQEEEEASMLNILLGYGSGAYDCKGWPSRRINDSVCVLQMMARVWC